MPPAESTYDSSTSFLPIERFGLKQKPRRRWKKCPPTNSFTPQEYIESGYQQLRVNLAAELLVRVKECSPDFFERLVVELLLTMGYGGIR